MQLQLRVASRWPLVAGATVFGHGEGIELQSFSQLV